jgi:hypothetical protein
MAHPLVATDWNVASYLWQNIAVTSGDLPVSALKDRENILKPVSAL